MANEGWQAKFEVYDGSQQATLIHMRPTPPGVKIRHTKSVYPGREEATTVLHSPAKCHLYSF
jgi:hypothetical protein